MCLIGCRSLCELSAGIHGRTVSDLETRVALQKIKYDDAMGKRHVEAVQQCAASTNFVLAIFHKAKVQAFAADDRRIIVRSMSKPAHEAWSDFE